MCQLTQTALKGFLTQKFKDENDCSDTTELDQDIEAGQKAADTVCQYVDWLLSTVNPNLPHEDPHAYKLNYLEGVAHHSIISRGGKSGDVYNEFIVK